MVSYDDLADCLKGEVLQDIAQDFFGARKAIDDEVEAFHAKEADLLLAGQRALCRYHLLRLLLGEERHVSEFCRLVKTDCDSLKRADGMIPCLSVKPPFAFSAEKRFVKFFVAIFKEVAAGFFAYNFGVVFRKTGDPVPRRTIGWSRYVEWAGEINERIDNVNRIYTPSCVLGVARSFDVEQAVLEQAIGSSVHGLGCAHDASMCLEHISVDGMGYGRLPVWSVEPEDLKKVYQFAGQLYQSDPARAKKVMNDLVQG